MKRVTSIAIPVLVVVGLVLIGLGLRPRVVGTAATATSAESAAAQRLRIHVPAASPTAGMIPSRTPRSPGSVMTAASPAPTAAGTTTPPTVHHSAHVEDDDLVDVPVAGRAPVSGGDAVEQAATRAARTFARPPAGVAAATWWAQVMPLLSAQAAADYAGTDPRRVPYATVTGPGVRMSQDGAEGSHLVVSVQVPTDAGPYVVRVRPVAPYQVMSIVPAGR